MADEGVLKLVLNTARLDEGLPIISERLSLQGLPWRLMVVSQEVVRNSQGGKGRTVGVFLQCVPDAPGSQNWSASAHVKLKLLNHNNPDKSLSKVFDHKYSNSSSDWGFSTFIKWKDLTEPSKGFLKDGEVFLEAAIQLKSKSEAQPMAGVGLGGMNPFLQCPGCSESFESSGTRQPMSLRCGHTFCSACLTKACSKSAGKVSLRCTTCRQEHSAEDGNEASLWFPNHSMTQIISNMLSKSKYICQTHQHDKNYYCFDDQELVCIYCAYHGGHSTHNCKHLDEARKETGDSITRARSSVSSHVSEAERRLQFAREERELLSSREAGVRQVIEDSYEQLMAALARQKELLFQELAERTAEISSNIDSNVKQLEEQFSKVKTIVSDSAAWASLPAREALERYAELQSELAKVPTLCSEVKLARGTEPCPSISFQMTPLSEVMSFGQLGRVVVEEGGGGGGGGRKDQRRGNGEVLKDLPSVKRRKTDTNLKL